MSHNVQKNQKIGPQRNSVIETNVKGHTEPENVKKNEGHHLIDWDEFDETFNKN